MFTEHVLHLKWRDIHASPNDVIVLASGKPQSEILILPCQISRCQPAAVLGFTRPHPAGDVLVLANFSENEQAVGAEVLSAMPDSAVELISGTRYVLRGGLALAPYGLMWLQVGR